MSYNQKQKMRYTNFLKILFIFLLVFVTFNGFHFNGDLDKTVIQNFSTIFISIVLEAMPFIMLGSFLSALIQVYVSEDTIAKIIPNNKFSGLVIASLIGLIFPVCECAIVPITRRLIKKGLPVNIAVTFMLAVPIVNPVVLIATYYAFFNKPEVVLIRAVSGLVSAIVIGFIIGKIETHNGNPIIDNYEDYYNKCYCGCGNEIGYHRKSKVIRIIDHTSGEMYNIGKFLILGAFISSLFQTFVSRSSIAIVGQHYFLSIIVMMLLAFILSICSEADAFIARTFLGQFTIGSISAFLILGPMIDIKNALMLSGAFKRKFVVNLIIYVSFICFLVGVVVNFTAGLGVIK